MTKTFQETETEQLLQEHAEDTAWAVGVLAGQGDADDSKAHAAWLLNKIGIYDSGKKADAMIERARNMGTGQSPLAQAVE